MYCEVHSGEEAETRLAGLGTAVVGLVVSEIVMPGMTGLQLAAIIAARWPAVPVLLVSGQGGPWAGYLGHFLPKPFTPDALVAAVTELLPSADHPSGQSQRPRAGRT